MNNAHYTIEDLAAFSTAELVTMYNDLTGKSIKKFSSRMAGLRQIMNAQAEFVAEEAPAASVEEEASDAADDSAAAEEAARCDARLTAARINKDWTRTCPGCGACEDITPAGLEGTAAESRNFCHSCSTEWFPETGKLYTAPKASPARAASIAASWAKPEVAAARASRSSVTVSGGGLDSTLEYPSLRAAFAALNLPLGQHIKFRGQLKAAGVLTFIDFTFTNLAK